MKLVKIVLGTEAMKLCEAEAMHDSSTLRCKLSIPSMIFILFVNIFIAFVYQCYSIFFFCEHLIWRISKCANRVKIMSKYNTFFWFWCQIWHFLFLSFWAICWHQNKTNWLTFWEFSFFSPNFARQCGFSKIYFTNNYFLTIVLTIFGTFC